MPWPEDLLLIRKGPFEPDRPRCHVHCVIDKSQHSIDGMPFRLRNGYRHDKTACSHSPFDLGEMLFGNRKRDVDGLNLIDDDQRWNVVGLDDISLMNDQIACSSIERGANGAVFEIQFGILNSRPVRTNGGCSILDRGPIRLKNGIVGFGARAKLIIHFLGNHSLLEQILITTRLRFSILGLSRVLGQVGFSLLCLSLISGQIPLSASQRCFKRAGIDLEKNFSFLHFLAFLEKHVHELATDQGLHRNGRIGLHIPDGTDLDGHILLNHTGHSDRDWIRFRFCIGLITGTSSE